jgi:hypothetical protein
VSIRALQYFLKEHPLPAGLPMVAQIDAQIAALAQRWSDTRDQAERSELFARMRALTETRDAIARHGN